MDHHHVFDPTEWAEKRKLAMVKASELRAQRRATVNARNITVRAESRESVSTQGGGAGWKFEDLAEKKNNKKPQVVVAASSRTRAATSPLEKRRATTAGGLGIFSHQKTVSSVRSSTVLSGRSRTVLSGTGNSSKTAAPGVKHESIKSRGSLFVSASRNSFNASKESVREPVNSSDPVTRQMIDRDTLRLENRSLFAKAIQFWRSQNIVETSRPDSSSSSAFPPRVSVYVRKRPLFDREAVGKEFDSVSVLSPNTIVTHNCLFQADLKTPFLNHSKFSFTHCFDETASNESVFEFAAKPLVNLSQSSGGLATLFCFGQTGSGKTHTMTAIEEMTSRHLFSPQTAEDVQIVVGVEFVELCGKKVYDLLSEEKNSVKLREAGDGSLSLEGATQLECASPDELSSVMEIAHKRRNTESTGANEASSRSHAVCILTPKTGGGKLLLVDLAGSERRKDSMWHDKDRQREGAEINASIHALKECIRMQRSKSAQAVIPFRLSTLTRILAETFTNPAAKLAVIATVSPCATDVEHTVNTLKTVHQLAVDPLPICEVKQTDMYPKESSSERIVPPKKWSPEQVARWLESQGETLSIPKSTTGAMLVRMPESRFVQACNGDEKRASKIYRSLRLLMLH